MANRHTLAVMELDSFKEWLISDGWEIQQTKGYYEVLRALKQGRKHPLIVYKRSVDKNIVHLTLLDRDTGVIRAYLRERKIGNGVEVHT